MNDRTPAIFRISSAAEKWNFLFLKSSAGDKHFFYCQAQR